MNNNESFPSLYNLADSDSMSAQKKYLDLVKADIFFVLSGVFLSLLKVENEEMQFYMNLIGVVFLVISLFATFAVNLLKYDKTWYGARAVAESVKSLSWKYSTCSHPFSRNLNETNSSSEFTDRLKEILSEKKYLNWSDDGSLGSTPQITNQMKALRDRTIEERLEAYLIQRVKNQRNWYSTKSNFHKKRKSKLFIAIFLSQILAIASSSWIIRFPQDPNLSGLFVSIGIALFSWLQLNKHAELSQVYALTAQELGFVEEKKSGVNTEETLSDFISDSENAISREHTMWAARRDS